MNVSLEIVYNSVKLSLSMIQSLLNPVKKLISPKVFSFSNLYISLRVLASRIKTEPLRMK